MQIVKSILIATLFLFAQAWGEDTAIEPSNVVILLAGSVHNGDYFAMGDSVEISGTVNGDVYVAASQIIIDGVVNGDVLAVGGSVDISGTVSHNIRILAGQVTLSGRVGHNATLIGGNIQFVSSGQIKGNAVSVAGNVDLASSIGSDATMLASNLRISSTVGNNVHAFVGQMRLTSRAHIGGNLEYSSNQIAWIEPQAKVNGKITHHPSFIQEIFAGRLMQAFMIGSRVATVLMNFLYTLFIGWILIRLYPKNLEMAIAAMTHRPWKAFVYGILLLVLLPLASLVLLMTILGTPFALTLLALNVISFYTAKVFSILWASNILFKRIGLKPNKLPTFCIGLVLYFLIAAIPFFGTIFAFACMVFGLGGAALSRTHKHPHRPEKASTK